MLTQATKKPARPAPPLPERVWVTPEVATEWLNLNVNNRKYRPAHAESFARDMLAGKWNEKVISGLHFIEGTGELGDGQHRLRAVEISGQPQWFYVQHVPATAVTEAIDKNARRGVVDGLHFAGIRANPVQAALARKILQMNMGFAPGGGGRHKPTDSEIAAIFTAPEAELVRRAASVATRIRYEDKLKARPSTIAIAYYQCAKVDQGCAEEFFERQLLHSEGLIYESPANALVRRLQNASTAGKKMTDVDQYNFIIHAWNHYRRGNVIHRLQAPENWGANGYALPT